jgi:hypothetical protein
MVLSVGLALDTVIKSYVELEHDSWEISKGPFIEV